MNFYHHLSPQAQSLSHQSGISAGWMDTPEGSQAFMVGCEHHQIVYLEPLTQVFAECYPETARSRIEHFAWAQFRRAADSVGCQHEAAYRELTGEAEALPSVSD